MEILKENLGTLSSGENLFYFHAILGVEYWSWWTICCLQNTKFWLRPKLNNSEARELLTISIV